MKEVEETYHAVTEKVVGAVDTKLAKNSMAAIGDR